MPKNTEKRSSRDQLIAALENQIRKQEEIIRTQEKALELLTKHNNELSGFLDQFFKAWQEIPRTISLKLVRSFNVAWKPPLHK